MNKLFITLAVLACFLFPAGGFAAEGASAVEVTEESLVAAETAPADPKRDEFADKEKHTLTRVVRETDSSGIPVVVLMAPEVEDGFGHISVDKETELGRELARLCPDGSTCKVTAVITNGTLTRLYSIQKVR